MSFEAAHKTKMVSQDKEPAISTKDPEVLAQEILNKLYFIQGKSKELATTNDWYMAVAYTVGTA